MTRAFCEFFIVTSLFAWWWTVFSSAHASVAERVLHTTRYEGRYKSFDIAMTRSLVDLGDRRFAIRASANNLFASIEEYEEFIWQADHKIRPTKYRYRQRIFGIKKSRKIDFDWDTATALATDKKKTRTLSLQPGTLGPMTYQLQLQLDLISGQKALTYDFINRGRLKRYTFNRIEATSIGHTQYRVDRAILVRRVREGSSRKTDLWFNIDDDYTLAGLAHTNGDKTNTLFITADKKFPPFADTPYELISQAGK